MNSRTFLLFAAVLLAFAAVSYASWTTESVILTPSIDRVMTNTLDDPQPDVIQYDNNTPASLNTGTNLWVRVRFTAPDTFQLRSLYFYTTNGSGNAAPCSIFVHTGTATAMGTQISAHRLAGNVPNFAWNDTNFPTVMNFSAGQEFYVVIGLMPGGQQAQGWHVIMDNANTGRSGASSAHTGTYSLAGGDYMIRAGGEVMVSFTDLAAEECYNSVDGTPKFNMLLGSAVSLKSQVRNLGNSLVPNYSVFFSVNGPGGVVFTNTENLVSLAEDTIAQVTADSLFTPATAGEYLVTCIATAAGDVVHANDTTKLRFFVGGNDRWYRYDDNAIADNYLGFTADNGWGVSYTPSQYPAYIDSIRVNVQTAGNGDFRIYMNDVTGMPGTTSAWAATPPCVAGWNTVAVSPQVTLLAGQSFTMAYIYSGLAFGKDDNAPNCAEITHMGTIAWQYGAGTWNEDNSGNWCMQAYLGTSSTLPNIVAHPDTLEFGSVDTTGNISVMLSCWILNTGVAPLNVSDINISPSSDVLRRAYAMSDTAFTVAPNDSEEVQFTFNPDQVRSYNGVATFLNNSANAPSKDVRLRATGIAANAAEESGQVLPVRFALLQNYPNPFNPETDIRFALPVSSTVRLSVYNSLGQEVAVLVNDVLPAGSHTAVFDGAAMPTGVYFYRLEAGSFTAVQKMLLLK